MKYWSYLAAKVLLVLAVLAGVWNLMLRIPSQERYTDFYEPYFRQPRFGYDLWWTLGVLVFWLFAVGLFYLVVWDQRRRCRICLRRLMMPVATGSWTHLLLIGPPKTEYICAYGHGTLKVPELQITGREAQDWEAHEDIWKELYSLDKKD
jgi:hypothetical protein